MGTNNKFTAKGVLLRWQFIVDECKKRDIDVISFGGDGDSRLLKAMKISYKLLCYSDPICKFATQNHLKASNIANILILNVLFLWLFCRILYTLQLN